LFLPIKDLTSGDETYGGGRYLDLEIKNIKKNKIEIDFNKLYNPWCAYSVGFNPNYSLENLFRSEMSANSVAPLDFPQSP
jgi:hypothetical protein